jgi:hypothetical protein
MAVYMITYDLNSTGQKYDEVIKAIKDSSTGVWCTFWKSSYLIKSYLTAQEINNNITPHLDGNDRLIVIEVKNNYSGWLTDDEWEYIRKEVFG